MLTYSNLVVLLGFLGTILSILYKHFWFIAIIVLILIMYKIFTYPIDMFNNDQNQN